MREQSAPKAGLAHLPPEVWALGAVSLLTDAASDMVYPLLPKLLATVGAGAFALGVMEGVAELIGSVVKIWAGRVADRTGKPGPLVVVGYGLATIARPFYFFATSAWHVVAARSTDRVGKGLRSAPRDAILGAAAKPSQRALAFGVHRAMDNMGAVVGALLAWLFLGVLAIPLRRVFVYSVIPGIAATAIALWAVTRAKSGPAAQADPPLASQSAEIPAAAKRLLLVTFIFALGASADSFLMQRLLDLKMPLALLPIAWITLQLGKSLLNVPGGALADRYGHRRVLLVSWCVYALSYGAFAFVHDAWATWALFALYALHYGLGEGAEKALLIELCPKASRGRAFGYQHAAHGLGLLPANIGFGLLYSFQPKLAFIASASAAAIAAVLLFALVPSGARAVTSAE